MPSENNHIDNFFRNKAAEATVDYSQVDADWQTMQSQLPKPDVKPAGGAAIGSRIMKYMSYVAGIAVVVIITIMAVSKMNTHSRLPQKPESRIPIVTNGSNTAPTPPGNNNKDLNVAIQTVPGVHSKNKQEHSKPLVELKLRENAPTLTVSAKLPDLETSTIKPDSRTVFSQFFSEIRKPELIYQIDNRRDTTIRCKEGTKVFIPAGCFKTVTDNPVNGIIQFHIQEFYDYSDIITNKLSTTSTGMPIETGGMLYMYATYSNEPIDIRPSAAILVQMPARNFKPDMRLFIAEPANARPNEFNHANSSGPWINWQDSGQQQYLFNDATKYIRVPNWLDEPYALKRTKQKTTAKFKLVKNSDYTLEEAREEMKSRYGWKYDEIKIKPDRRLFMKKRYVRKFRDRNVNDTYDLTGYIGDSISIPLYSAMQNKLISREDSLAYEKQRRKEFEEALRMKKPIDEYIRAASSYDFRIHNLGWINCDRFLAYPRSRLTDMAFDPGPGFEGMYFEAKMIFDVEKAIMPGFWNNGKVVFQNLPVGHKVHVICTGAKDGKMFASFQEIIVKPHQSPVLQFEETNPREFRNKLSQFGSVR